MNPAKRIPAPMAARSQSGGPVRREMKTDVYEAIERATVAKARRGKK
jgi:hypothetical protein